jgi:hypothetical protein
LENGAVKLPIEAAARAGGGGGQGGDTGCFKAEEKGMVIRHCWNVKGNTGTGFKEGGEVNTVKTGRGFTTTKPRELNFCREQDMKGINARAGSSNFSVGHADWESD